MGVTITNQSGSQTDLVGINRPLSKKEIRTKFLSDFKSRIEDATDRLFLFYGRPYVYDDDSPAGDEPPFPQDSVSDDIETRKAIMALRLIRSDDAINAFVLNANGINANWQSGRVYDEYSNLIDLSSKQYYVFTDESKLYICLNNNGDRNSTIKPSSNDGAPFDTSDGYRWKLLINYRDSRLRKFNAPTHLPVPPQTSTEILVSKDGGQLERLDLAIGAFNSPPNSPQGYDYTESLDSPRSLNSPESREEIPLFIKGDGDDVRTARGTGTTVSGSTLASVSISNAGSGYHNDPVRGSVPVELRLTNPSEALSDFSLAYGLATVSSTGTITGVSVVNAGNGYPNNASLTIVQSSAIAYINVDTSNGEIINDSIIKPFTIEQSGKNFTTASVISVVDAGINTADESIDPILSPIAGHGNNIKSELNATSLFINVRITSGIDEFSNSNDFRQIGIMANPKNTNTPSTAIIDNFVDASSSITVTEVGGSSFDNISADAIIEGRSSLHKGRLIDVLTVTGSPTKRKIRFLNDPNEPITSNFTPGETVDITTPGGKDDFIVGSASEVTSSPVDIMKSGEILFINNSNPITRTADQSETINFIFNF